MGSAEKRLSSLASFQDSGVSLDRTSLKDRAARVLREYISSGRIPEGTKLTEREVSRLLGISRAPARDALMALESEGLVVTRSSGRYVIQLSEEDVRGIHVVRWTLERLAVELAASELTASGTAVLQEALLVLEEAIAAGDAHLWAQADLDLHRKIWQLSGNDQLLKVLDSMLGGIRVMAAREKIHAVRHPDLDLENHRRLVRLIIAGDGAGAAAEVEKQIKGALDNALETLDLEEGKGTQDGKGDKEVGV
jgi:DNA-binding GntR family transcriptional regulator